MGTTLMNAKILKVIGGSLLLLGALAILLFASTGDVDFSVGVVEGYRKLDEILATL